MRTERRAYIPAQDRWESDARWHARSLVHKVQIRPDVEARTWFWSCLTCGDETRSAAIYDNVADATVAAWSHNENLEVLR